MMRLLLWSSEQLYVFQAEDGRLFLGSNNESLEQIDTHGDLQLTIQILRLKAGHLRVVGRDGQSPVFADPSAIPAMQPKRLPSGELVIMPAETGVRKA